MSRESRVETDIAELVGPGTSPNQPTDTDQPPVSRIRKIKAVLAAVQRLEPHENGKPRRWAEFSVAASSVIFVGLLVAPAELKQGYVLVTAGAYSMVLLSMLLSLACLFWGNTHIKMIRFLSGKPIFSEVVVLALIDFLRIMILPGPGWEVTNRIYATTALLCRLTFICFDSLKGMSRWFRLFIAFFFMLGNVNGIFAAYFSDETQIIYTISATNTTITTSAVKASVGTTLVTLLASMLVTIWQDKDFQYCALYRSFLPKLAVESAGVVPGSAEMELILGQRDAAVTAWRGWPRKSAVAILLSVVVYLASIMAQPKLEYDLDGRESMAMLVMRGITLMLGVGGSCVFFHNNVNWRRLKYAFTSTQGILWIFYTLTYAFASLSRPNRIASVSGNLGTVYTMLGFIGWLSLEAVQQISRLMHITITLFVTLTLAMAIYLSVYVWQDDVDLIGSNRITVYTVTVYAVMRTCFINMLLLMAGSLGTIVTKNLTLNGYFTLVEGNVLRQEIMESESLNINPDGHHDLIGHNSMQRRLSRHRTPSLATRRGQTGK